MTIANKKTNVSYKQALDIFQKAKKFLGNKDYYEVIGNAGYEKSSEIPFEKLDDVYRLLIDKYIDKRDEEQVGTNGENENDG